MELLKRIADEPGIPFDLLHDALQEICRRRRYKPPPPLTANEVLDRIWRDERVPKELRVQAARLVLPLYPPPGGNAGPTKESKR